MFRGTDRMKDIFKVAKKIADPENTFQKLQLNFMEACIDAHKSLEKRVEGLDHKYHSGMKDLKKEFNKLSLLVQSSLDTMGKQISSVEKKIEDLEKKIDDEFDTLTKLILSKFP
jgi:flagellar capping protein FliD